MAKSDTQSRARAHGLPDDLQLLLNEIESEPVPDRLLELAKELQRRLAAAKRELPDDSGH